MFCLTKATRLCHSAAIPPTIISPLTLLTLGRLQRKPRKTKISRIVIVENCLLSPLWPDGCQNILFLLAAVILLMVVEAKLLSAVVAPAHQISLIMSILRDNPLISDSHLTAMITVSTAAILVAITVSLALVTGVLKS